MNDNTSEWELSKENIRPLQKGRKTGMLRLSEQPIDELTAKRKQFEHQLRIYTGDDPLSIWCDYIKWVEQSYPKGGKEGNLGKLIQQCLQTFKEETMYQDDKRFIDIWLKFVNICVKPSEVYLNMYKNNIGCKIARFFIAWAWEMEQLGNFKRADEILIEGINRRADPIEDLRCEHSRLEMKMATAFASDGKQQLDEDKAARSAFAVLKRQDKNKAPITRVGPMVHPATKENLTIGHKQPQPKKNTSSKLPFSIYSAENQPVNKACAREEGAKFAVTTENFKENEKKPSKWTKVKVPQAVPAVALKPRMPSFTLHEDDTPQPSSTKKNPNEKQVLTTWKDSSAPAMAIFEPPDPMKRPMYNKIKVYGGVEEFSFEEIRAAVWWEKKSKLEEEEKRLAEQKRMNDVLEHVRRLEEKLEMLQSQVKTKDQEVISSSKTVSPIESECKQGDDSELAIDRKCANINESIRNLSMLQPKVEHVTISKLATPKDVTSLVPPPPRFEIKPTSTAKNVKNKYCLNGSRVEMPTNIISEVMGDLFNATGSRSMDNSDASTTTNAKASSLIENSASKLKVERHKEDSMHSRPSTPPPPQQETPKQMSSVIEPNIGKKSAFPFAIFQDSVTKERIPSENTEPSTSEEDPQQDENAPPSDYVQVCEKRELAGILQPSKNIPFIPLEEQLKELEEDSDEEVDGYLPDANEKCNEDYTMIPPANTMQFAHFAQFVSTPCEKPVQKVPLRNAEADETYGKKESSTLLTEFILKDMLDILNMNDNPRIEDIVRNAMESITASNVTDKNYKAAYYNLQSCLGLTDCERLKSALNHAMSQINLAEPKNANKSVTAIVQPSWVLSTIMETSREGSTKSSSSSSCNSISSIQKHKTSLCTAFKKPLENSSSLFTKDSRVTQPMKTYCTEMNPFDSKFTDSLLQTLSVPVTSLSNYYDFGMTRVPIRPAYNIKLESVNCIVEGISAEGAYAQIYVAKPVAANMGEVTSNSFAVKVCQSSNAWEFYVCSELQDRISDDSTKYDLSEAVMKVICAMSYRNHIVLISDFCPYGSLLNVVNAYKQSTGNPVPEIIVLYFTLEMLMIMSRIHECNILHGDIKPDNFVLVQIPEKFNDFNKPRCLRLIDFGRSIDLTFFEPGITFKTCVNTDSFKCIEMSEGKPWVHQPDWYGIIGSIHVLLFGNYMKVEKDRHNMWTPVSKFRRYWQTDIWEPLFKSFLNMPTCYDVADVKPFIDAIISRLEKQESTFLAKSREMHQFLN